MYKVGDIFKAFGVKGYVKVKNLFEEPNLIYKKGNEFTINDSKYTLEDYKIHQNYYLLKFEEITDRNDVSLIDKKFIYINKENVSAENTILQELLNFKIIYNNKEEGIITNIVYEPLKLIRINNQYFIPFNDDFIKNIDYDNKQIEVLRLDEFK